MSTPECTLPPPGWKCTRPAGHDGPCAAVPNWEKLQKLHCGHESRYLVEQGQEIYCSLCAIADLNQRLIERTEGFMQTLQSQSLELNHARTAFQLEKVYLAGFIYCFAKKPSPEDLPHYVPAHSLALALRQRDNASAQIERMIQHHQEHLETDSLVASCGCLTKTNDPQHHKPGCKYRLISERDAARAEVIKLTQQKNELRDYAILALYEHSHITEAEACRLTRLDVVSFRLLRENAFQSMCKLLTLPTPPSPLPQP